MTEPAAAAFVAVVTTVADRAAADRIAFASVEARLGACARISAATSVYRWNGAVETAEEFVVEIKTARVRLPDLEALIARLHPYELPEIVVHPIVGGSTAYLGWLSAETAAGS